MNEAQQIMHRLKNSIRPTKLFVEITMALQIKAFPCQLSQMMVQF
jgi:hypothetical protein